MYEYDDNLLEPVSHYENTLKDRVKDAAERHFDKLIEQSQINIEENRQTVKQYDDANEYFKEENRKLNKLLSGRTALVVLAIISGLAGIILILLGSFNVLNIILGISIGSVLLVLMIVLFIIIGAVLNKKISAQREIVDKAEEKKGKLYALAKAQMAPLFGLFDYSTAYEIFDEAVDIINFDKFFDKKKLRYLIEKCDYQVDDDEKHSTIYVKSGEILGNPFILKKTQFQSTTNKTYYGSRVVVYTDTYRDSDGNLRTRTVTETLRASVIKPAPLYGRYTDLIYGNQAAPDLSFSRLPSGYDAKMSDKEKDKFLEKKEDELHERAERALKDGKHFQPLANTEFEVFFNALNRDHESQYRLLFTPLAQRNFMDIFESENSYGDDFEFIKKKRTNFISSAHTQSMHLVAEPEFFVSHSHDIAKQTFVYYVTSFFKSLYFDFVPLLSIPLYQQLKTLEYIYEEEIESNNTMYEAEMIANRFDDDDFAHPNTAPGIRQILRAKFVEKNGESDKVVVRAHSFEGQPRIDIVPVMARNGCLYDVPVEWIEYLPIHKDSVVQVKKLDTTRPDFIKKARSDDSEFAAYAKKLGKNEYFDKLFAFISTSEYFNESDDSELSNMYNK